MGIGMNSGLKKRMIQSFAFFKQCLEFRNQFQVVESEAG